MEVTFFLMPQFFSYQNEKEKKTLSEIWRKYAHKSNLLKSVQCQDRHHSENHLVWLGTSKRIHPLTIWHWYFFTNHITLSVHFSTSPSKMLYKYEIAFPFLLKGKIIFRSSSPYKNRRKQYKITTPTHGIEPYLSFDQETR